MEWQQIVGFYHVAKLRSFTRAAEATFRTQSALTQQIKALEKEFDCELFERIGRRTIALTPIGKRLFLYAESILAGYEQLSEDIAGHKGLKKGRLRIAGPFTLLYHHLPEVIRIYNRTFPWVKLSLLDRPQKDVIELVISGEVDFGMALEGLVPRELRKSRWKKVEPVLLVQAGHPLAHKKKVSLEEIARYPLIFPPKSGSMLNCGKLGKLFIDHNLDYFVVMESSNIEIGSHYAEMGIGISFASLVEGSPVFRHRKLARVSLDHLLAPEYMCIVTRTDKKTTPYQETFLSMLKSD